MHNEKKLTQIKLQKKNHIPSWVNLAIILIIILNRKNSIKLSLSSILVFHVSVKDGQIIESSCKLNPAFCEHLDQWGIKRRVASIPLVELYSLEPPQKGA